MVLDMRRRIYEGEAEWRSQENRWQPTVFLAIVPTTRQVGEKRYVRTFCRLEVARNETWQEISDRVMDESGRETEMMKKRIQNLEKRYNSELRGSTPRSKEGVVIMSMYEVPNGKNTGGDMMNMRRVIDIDVKPIHNHSCAKNAGIFQEENQIRKIGGMIGGAAAPLNYSQANTARIMLPIKEKHALTMVWICKEVQVMTIEEMKDEKAHELFIGKQGRYTKRREGMGREKGEPNTYVLRNNAQATGGATEDKWEIATVHTGAVRLMVRRNEVVRTGETKREPKP